MVSCLVGIVHSTMLKLDFDYKGVLFCCAGNSMQGFEKWGWSEAAKKCTECAGTSHGKRKWWSWSGQLKL